MTEMAATVARWGGRWLAVVWHMFAAGLVNLPGAPLVTLAVHIPCWFPGCRKLVDAYFVVTYTRWKCFRSCDVVRMTGGGVGCTAGREPPAFSGPRNPG